jgi:hypothetical protein
MNPSTEHAQEDTRIDVMNSCTEHIILYAKHQYGKSGNVVEDLRLILGEVCNVPTECMRERDVHECLAAAWSELAPVIGYHNLREGLLEMLGWKWPAGTGMERTPEEVMMGRLGQISPRDVKFLEGKGVDESRMASHRFGKKLEEQKKEQEVSA